MSAELEKALRFDLLRHGITDAGKCFLGSTNARLTDIGMQQMKRAALADDYQLVISSPLLRCREFAEIYASEHSVSLEIIDELREIDFGVWEGKRSETLWKEQQQALSNFWKDPFKHTPPDGEAMHDFVERVTKQFKDLSTKHAGKKVLLVGHAGVCKVIICEALKLPVNDMHKLSIDHGGLSRISLWPDYGQLEFMNR